MTSVRSLDQIAKNGDSLLCPKAFILFANAAQPLRAASTERAVPIFRPVRSSGAPLTTGQAPGPSPTSPKC